MAIIHGTAGNDTLTGTTATDTIYGYDGDDVLTTGPSNETANRNYLYGGNGNDTLIAGPGGGQNGNFFFGDAGEDLFVWNRNSWKGTINDSSGSYDTIYFANSTFANLRLEAGAADLTIRTQFTNNYFIIKNQITSTAIERLAFADGSVYSLNRGVATLISSTSGDDVIYLSAYADTFNAGDGDDIVHGMGGADILDGGAGNDTISYALHDRGVTVNLLGGFSDENGDGIRDDSLTNFENVIGTNFADTIWGDSFANVINGGGGDDKLSGNGGNDTIYGGDGNDELFGNTGDDLLYGEAGNDALRGGDGNDTLNGGDGDDDLYGDEGDDILYGGAGTDRLFGGNGHDTLYGGDGNDTLRGEAGDDILDGGAGNDDLRGGAGNDTLYGGDGNDRLEGNEGDDILYGGAGDDTLMGGAGNDRLEGGDGNDTLRGEGGDDILIGGLGHDDLYGGAGADTFAFLMSSSFDTWDEIHDFSLAQGDMLDLSDLLSAYNPLTDLITDFVRITDNGRHSFLQIDVDGGANSFVKIAQINNITGLTDEQALVDSGHILI